MKEMFVKTLKYVRKCQPRSIEGEFVLGMTYCGCRLITAVMEEQIYRSSESKKHRHHSKHSNRQYYENKKTKLELDPD